MKTRIALGVIVMMFALVQAGFAGPSDVLNKYFNDTACKVKATSDPAQKREILSTSLQTMTTVLDRVEASGLLPQSDRAGIEHFKSTVQEKRDELTGSNGYQRVADAQLNDFSEYVVQDMEQAPHTVTISLVALLLIILILVLII